MTGPSTFRLLNRAHSIDGPWDWNDQQRDKLWLYHLHYFDDLIADSSQVRADWHRQLLERWIAEKPAGQEVALAGNELGDAAWGSLAVQVRHLRNRIEWHLLGNHLLANATALVFASCIFDGVEAEGWRAKGLGILERELPEQVLSDGGHFELSPMYHTIVLSDLLDLINLARAPWRRRRGRSRPMLAGSGCRGRRAHPVRLRF
jgi:hypothetical protein